MSGVVEPKAVDDVQGDGRWMSLHESFVQLGKDKEPEVVLIGDSIVQLMAQSPLWQQMFEPLHCLNFGLGGDRTEHVLWRIINGEFESVSPKVVVLHVGTNNHGDSAALVASGIMACVEAIRQRQPSTHIVVLGILPRGEKPNQLRKKNTEINNTIQNDLESVPMTTFLRIEDKEFVGDDGRIPRALMYDFLHLTMGEGYQRVCEPLADCLQNLLGTYIKDAGADSASLCGDI